MSQSKSGAIAAIKAVNYTEISAIILKCEWLYNEGLAVSL
jgi:hypothetical protein